MKVLIAIDESEFLDAIENFVTSREWPAHTSFRILHVVEPLPNLTGLLPTAISEMIKHDAHQHGLHLTRRMAMRIRDYFKTEHVEELVIEGNAREEIVLNAVNWPADLIVVGSHNKNVFDRLRLGSVSSIVLSSAPCPVAIARQHVPAEAERLSDEASQKETTSV